MAQNFLTSSRHGTVFYFRRRVPDDLRRIIGKPYLVKTLNTVHRGAAVVLARAYAAKTDAIYQELRAMKKNNPENFELDYSLKLEFNDLGQVRKMEVDAQLDESDAEVAKQLGPSRAAIYRIQKSPCAGFASSRAWS